MLIKINGNNTEEFHNSLKKTVKTKLKKEGYVYQSDFPESFGDLSIKTYNFDNGFNFNVLKGDISDFLQLEFLEDDNNFIRYFFVLKGDMIHSVSTSVRYRLNDGYSCMVAAKGESNQLFSFPIQKNVNILFLQVATKRFGIDSKQDLVNLPKEIGDVFMNKVMDNHFIYHSNYTLSILDTIMEIFNTKKEGIVRRFYLESKALELLWLQTEIYKEEVNLGFNKKILRKRDIEIIKRAKDHLHENQNENLTLSSVSKALGTNETKLKTGFKRLYGKTFTEILRAERLTTAKAMLEEGELSVKEIANSCGYKSVSMFSLRFKERFGETPGKLINS